MDNLVISKGNPLLMGCRKVNRNYNFSYYSESKSMSLIIYDSKGSKEVLRVNMGEDYKTGDIFSCKIAGKGIDRCLYEYECDGKKYIDPYAKTVTSCTQFGIVEETPHYLSRVELDRFDWEDDRPLNIPYDEACFYKINVRGFTKSRTSKVKHKGTFAGIVEKIPYLKELGVTTIELMPAYEFDECQRFTQLNEQNSYGKYAPAIISAPVNYWGYVRGFYFAPKAAFSYSSSVKSDYTDEFKRMVKKLHKNGIEVVMEMYFKEVPAQLALDCMRYWVTEYHIDGIHLYADEEVLNVAAGDPLLAKTKIITVFWDKVVHSFKNMANYNDGFLNVSRMFLKGEENQLADFVNVIKNNPLQSANINYITNHNGFTLLDLVSYDRKHNEANGENNSDGENFNKSWNCGVEGKTRKRKVIELRKKQIKNAFMMVLLSQGTPLILGGDEFMNTQNGNNNPYCIDSETSWLNWKDSDDAKEITDFVKELIMFRKHHKILHLPKQLLASDQLSCGYPDVSYHGSSAWYNAMENYNRHIGVMYCSRYAKDINNEQEDELIYVGYNMHWEKHELALPKASSDCKWKIYMCSGSGKEAEIKDDRMVLLSPHCIAVLIGHVKKTRENNVSTAEKMLIQEKSDR